MSKKVAVLVRDKERQYEGLRSSLGLHLERHAVSMFVLDHEVELTDEYADNMGFIDEMGGARYSNVAANVHKYGFEPATVEEMGRMLNGSEVIIPF